MRSILIYFFGAGFGLPLGFGIVLPLVPPLFGGVGLGIGFGLFCLAMIISVYTCENQNAKNTCPKQKY
jgi:hypothetical protein